MARFLLLLKHSEPADRVAERSTHENIGREVGCQRKPRKSDECRRTVRNVRNPLMVAVAPRNDSRNGKGNYTVGRGEPSSRAKGRTFAVAPRVVQVSLRRVGGRASTISDILQNRRQDLRVSDRLAREQCSVLCFVIFSDKSDNVKRCRSDHHADSGRVAGENIVELMKGRSPAKVIRFGGVECQQSASSSEDCNRRNPVVTMSKSDWKSPNVFLVAEDVR